MGHVMWLLFIVSIISHGECKNQMSKEFGGPYTVQFTSMEDCKDPGNGDIIFRTNKLNYIGNNTYMINDTLILKRPFTEDLIGTVDISILSNSGGWKPHAYTVEKPVCSFFKDVLKYAKDFFDVMGGDCPIAPGRYPLNNIKLVKEFSFPVLPYGKYKGECFISDGQTRLFCKNVGVELIPKLYN